MLMQVRMITPMPRSILKYFSATGRNPGRSPPSISAVKWAAERTATRVPEAWNAVGTTLCFFITTRETATPGVPEIASRRLRRRIRIHSCFPGTAFSPVAPAGAAAADTATKVSGAVPE